MYFSNMQHIDLHLLPPNARKEITDFYEFLLVKYGLKNKSYNLSQNRPSGLAQGEIEISDDFDEPLPKDIEDAFYK